MIKSPPRILTEPLARLLASELGLHYDNLPPHHPRLTPSGSVAGAPGPQSVPLDQKTLRAITRKLVWAYISHQREHADDKLFFDKTRSNSKK